MTSNSTLSLHHIISSVPSRPPKTVPYLTLREPMHDRSYLSRHRQASVTEVGNWRTRGVSASSILFSHCHHHSPRFLIMLPLPRSPKLRPWSLSLEWPGPPPDLQGFACHRAQASEMCSKVSCAF